MPNNTVAWLSISVIAVAGVAAGAAAETKWQKNHPRQLQVTKSANVQTGRTNSAFRNGKITGYQERRLDREDRAIKAEDRRDAKINGGTITKGQKQHMLRQVGAITKQRTHDVKADASAK